MGIRPKGIRVPITIMTPRTQSIVTTRATTAALGCLLLPALLSPSGLLAQGSCTVPHGISGALTSARRSMLEVFPTLGMPIGSGFLELGARVPISGRNLPAGNALSLSFFLPWGLGDSLPVTGLDEFD